MLTLWSSMIFQKRSFAGKFGAPSYITTVAPLASGPYTTYECPVTQPISAVHQYVSSSCKSKTSFDVKYGCVRYPPVVCTTPLGLPVVPLVYKMKSGCSLSSFSRSEERRVGKECR